jgi:hypothetical protein
MRITMRIWILSILCHGGKVHFEVFFTATKKMRFLAKKYSKNAKNTQKSTILSQEIEKMTRIFAFCAKFKRDLSKLKRFVIGFDRNRSILDGL